MISERSANRGAWRAGVSQGLHADRARRPAPRSTRVSDLARVSRRTMSSARSPPRVPMPQGRGAEEARGVRRDRDTRIPAVARFPGGRNEQPVSPDAVEPLVQIYSRGFTSSLLHGRGGRDFVTRDRPDNRGIALGTVVAANGGEIVVDVSREIHAGDGLAFDLPGEPRTGGTVLAVRATKRTGSVFRQTLAVRERARRGATVVRNADAELLAASQASYASVEVLEPPRIPLHVRLSGQAGGPLAGEFTAGTGPDAESVSFSTKAALAAATRRSIDDAQCRAQLGRLGDTPFVLAGIDRSALADGLFLPVSELNHLRQRAVVALDTRRDWSRAAARIQRAERIASLVTLPARVPATDSPANPSYMLAVSVYQTDDARTAASAGATDIILDPFLRHPAPPVSRVRALAAELASPALHCGCARRPSCVRLTAAIWRNGCSSIHRSSPGISGWHAN